MKVFVFGNPLVEGDSLALKVAKRLEGRLQGVEFKAVQDIDEIEEKDFVALDVAEGIERVQVIEDLDELDARQPVSGHDFDLAMELRMRKKVGRLGRVRIIAVPCGLDLKKAVASVRAIVSSLP
jgi:hypothetical protein